MAARYWGDMSILVDDLEVGGFGTNFSLRGSRAVLPRTTLDTSGWTASGKGLRQSEFSLDFLQDFAVGSVDEEFAELLASESHAQSIVVNTADGSVAYLMNGVATSYTALTGSVGENAMGRLNAVTSGVLARGLLMHPGNTARTSSSTGTARQLGAVGATQRMYAALHVLSVSGTATPTLTVSLHSDNASNFPSTTSRIAFSAATTTGSQWGSVAGAITDDWWRASWTISGTNPSFLFALTAGIY